MTDRTTHYIKAVRHYMAEAGHASNADILRRLRDHYPGLSATTVHRITARMVERHELAFAPPAKNNTMRFDVNTVQHDHFMCENCLTLRDTHIANIIRPIVEQSIGDNCRISGTLTISGLCKNCNKETQ